MTTYTAKSVIVDVANNYGRSGAGLRSIEFKLSGASPTVYYYDLEGYGSKYSDTYSVARAFYNVGLSKIGISNYNSWYAAPGVNTNVRISCVFTTEITFDSVVVNNYHSNGASTDGGSKDIKIIITPEVVTSTTYLEAVPSGFLLFDGTLDEHVPSNIVDDQILTLNEPPPGIAVSRGAEGEVAEQGLFGATSRGAEGDASTLNFCEITVARGAEGTAVLPGFYATTSRGMVTNPDYPYDVTDDAVVNASASRTFEGDVIDSEFGGIRRSISARGAIAALGFDGIAGAARGVSGEASQVLSASLKFGISRGAVASLGFEALAAAARGVFGSTSRIHSASGKAGTARGATLNVFNSYTYGSTATARGVLGSAVIDALANGNICLSRGAKGIVQKNGVVNGNACNARGIEGDVITELFADLSIYLSRGAGSYSSMLPEVGVKVTSEVTTALTYKRSYVA